MKLLARYPLWAANNARDSTIANQLSSGKDAIVTRAVPTVVYDTLQQKKQFYLEKFPGWAAFDTIDSGKAGEFSFSGDNGVLSGWMNVSLAGVDVYFSDEPPGVTTATPVYCGNTGIGAATTAVVRQVSEFELNGTFYYAIVSTAGQAVYLLSEAALSGAVTFTGDTHTNTTIDNVSSTTGLVVGQYISGTDIAANTRIATIGVGTITTTIATTGSHSGITVTRERMAKIIDSDFPTTIPLGAMQELNGRVFIGDGVNSRIYQSALNDPFSWAANEYVTCNQAGDNLFGIAKYRNYIVGIGSRSLEFYAYANVSSGSQLVLADNLTQQHAGGWTVLSNGPLISNGDLVAFGSLSGGLYMLQDFKAVQIADDIGSRPPSLSLSTSNRLDAFWLYGRQFLMQSVASSFQRIYDIQNKMWINAGFTDYIRCTANLGAPLFGVSLSATTGKRYYLDQTTRVWQDDGVAYSMQIRLPNDNCGSGNRKFVQYYELIGDKQASGSVTLEVNDNDYDSSSWVTVGTLDLTVARKFISGGGSFPGERAHRLTHSANTANRMRYLEVWGEVGAT